MAETQPKCKYGKNCYRKSADHLRRFSHDDEQDVKDDKNHEFGDGEPPTKRLREDTGQTEILQNVKEGNKSSQIDAHHTIKETFGIDMPQDFYDLWYFCQELNPKEPHVALKDDLNLELVGPYDILCGKEVRSTEDEVHYSLHYRYFYDPPEFVTVLKGDDSNGSHIGYYRDEPDEKPVLVACNEAKVNCEFKILGNNIFAGISNYIQNTSKQRKSKDVGGLKAQLDLRAKKGNYPLEVNPPSIRQRNEKVVAKTFHKMGIVVPLDDNGVGYRDLQVSNAELKKMLKDIVNGKQREHLLDELQDIITRIQFANDECDYGMGLELGLDLFSFGHEMFHKKSLMLLSLAYDLLGKNAFAEIAKSHLKYREKETLYIKLTSS